MGRLPLAFLAAHRFAGVDQRSGRFEELDPLRRELWGGAEPPHEQRVPQPVLEQGDLIAHRRLRNTKFGRGMAEASRPRGANECTQLPLV